MSNLSNIPGDRDPLAQFLAQVRNAGNEGAKVRLFFELAEKFCDRVGEG
jgi:nitrate reductase alpha subunit